MLRTALEQGGPVAYLLLGCSIVALALILERAVFWILEKRRFKDAEMRSLLNTIARGRRAEAATLAAQSSNPLLRRLSELLPAVDVSILLDAANVEVDEAQDRAFRNHSGLQTLIAIAPLLGILGTVLGIINSFAVMEEAMLNDPSLVGAGLAEALLTTAFGLLITVPALIALGLFKSMGNRHLRRLEKFCDELELSVALSAQHASESEFAAPSSIRRVG